MIIINNIVTWINIIVCRILVIERNTWNNKTVYRLFILDRNTWLSTQKHLDYNYTKKFDMLNDLKIQPSFYSISDFIISSVGFNDLSGAYIFLRRLTN